MDDLASGRRLRDDLRQLKERYPELTTPEAQARLSAYMRTQTDDIGIPTERKERPMPAKGQRTFQEDLLLATVRLPKSDMDAVDRHIETLQRQHRFTGWSRSDALRDLIQRGLDSLTTSSPTAPLVEPAAERSALAAMHEETAAAIERLTGKPIVPLVEPAAVSAGGAIPSAPAYEARALTPDLTDDDELEDQPLGPEPPRTMEPPAAQTEDVRPARSRRTARPKATPPLPIQPKRASRAQRGD